MRDPAVTPTSIFWVRNKLPFSDFLTPGEDADPDIPILKEAKAEWAKPQKKTRPDFLAHLGTLVSAIDPFVATCYKCPFYHGVSRAED
jgi:hypothetical protein